MCRSSQLVSKSTYAQSFLHVFHPVYLWWISLRWHHKLMRSLGFLTFGWESGHAGVLHDDTRPLLQIFMHLGYFVSLRHSQQMLSHDMWHTDSWMLWDCVLWVQHLQDSATVQGIRHQYISSELWCFVRFDNSSLLCQKVISAATVAWPARQHLISSHHGETY